MRERVIVIAGAPSTTPGPVGGDDADDSTILGPMASDGRPLDVAAIRAALDALARELSAAHQRGELLVVGGAAMALLYDARPTTKDVDVYIVEPKDARIVRQAAMRVAEALDLRMTGSTTAPRDTFTGSPWERRCSRGTR